MFCFRFGIFFFYLHKKRERKKKHLKIVDLTKHKIHATIDIDMDVFLMKCCNIKVIEFMDKLQENNFFLFNLLTVRLFKPNLTCM